MIYKSKAVRKIALRAFQGVFFLASRLRAKSALRRAMRAIALAAAGLLIPTTSSAQSPVNVTATVKDSAGIPYSNATVSILLIPTGTAPTVGGAQINGTNNGQLDVNGKLNVSLYKNTDIVPASSQWQFTICETPGVAPPLGTGGQCFTSSQTVSAAVDFSTQFQAAAPALSTVTLGAGSVTHTGGALTANLPVIGAGGADIAVGTRTGNTTLFPTFTGAATAARCVDTDASGNLQVTSSDCGGGVFPLTVSGTVNSGGIPCFTSTTVEASSSLLVQYGILQGGGAGVCPSTVSPPTTPNGVPFILTSTPAGGLAVASTFSPPGVPVNAQTGTTYTIAATDRAGVVTDSNVGATAITLPQAGSTNFANNFNFGLFNINTGLVTITPTTSTINGAATQIVPNKWGSFIYSDPSNNYRALTIPDIGAFPSCADSGGNHLNFTTATGALSCGTSGASAALSALTAAAGTNTLANGNNPQIWNWAQTTDSQAGFTPCGETSAATNGTLTNGLANQSACKMSTATNSTATPLSVVQGSITNTVATPLAQFQGTWNNAGLSGEGLLMNITNTASASTSKIADFQVGNATKFQISPTGIVNVPSTGQFGVETGTSPTDRNMLLTNDGLYMANGARDLVFYSSRPDVGSIDGNISRVGAGLIGIGTGNSASVAGRLEAAGYECVQAADIGAQAANTATYMCPAAVTAWRAAVPAAAPAGIILNSNVAGLITQSTSGDSNHAVHVTAQTATKTIYTLCPASAGGCNVAGQYRITWYFNQGGTACGTPAPGQVTFEVSWTDNAGAHTTVALPMNDNSSIAVFTSAFKFAASNTTGFASGEFNLWSTGAQPIQVTNTYTACAVGTGTWELTAAVEQVQ